MKTSKRTSVNDAHAPISQRLNVKVTPDAYERLLIHAIKARKSPGEVITQLIKTHLNEWALPAKVGARAASHDRLQNDVPVDNSAPAPALQDAA